MAKSVYRRAIFYFLAFSSFLSGGFKIQADVGQLTLDWISLESNKSVGMTPRSVLWSEDGKSIYFRWNPNRDKNWLGDLYRVSPEGGVPVRIPDEDLWKIPEWGGSRNEQGTYTVYGKYGDIFLKEVKTGQVKRIFKTEKGEGNPRFLKSGKSFTFEMDGNIHIYDIFSGSITQLTDIRPAEDPDKKPELSKEEEYLKKQQEELFDVLKKRKEDKKNSEEMWKKEDPRPKPYYLGSPKKKIVNTVPSPDGQYVGIVVEDTSKSDQARTGLVTKYVTESGFVETEGLTRGPWTRGKVGSFPATTRTGVYEVKTGKVTWAEVELGNREVNHNEPIWSDDGSQFAFVIGSVDNKDRWIAVFDIKTGKTELVDHEREEAWFRHLISGRGSMSIPWFGFTYMGWLNDDTLFFLSERDGWLHIYTCRISTKKLAQLTHGKWEVDYIRLSKDKLKFFLTTTEVQPGERQLYSMSVKGGDMTRITAESGWNFPFFSPDESRIALIYSNSNTPEELFVMSNKPGAKMKILTDSTTTEFKSLRLPQPRIVTFPDADGNLIYGDLYPPKSTEEKRPAILFIHGAGYMQAVYNRWSYDWADERLLNHYLSQQGYVVLSIDYRGSEAYGRDCRTAIYRHMGGKDVDSALAAVQYLTKNHNVDPKRIGLYGASYGGFFTLMALFTHPGVFAAGVATYPVTDWAHYGHGYTSSILNLPYEDEEAYKRSSPIYLANGLQDHLLIVHGIEDSNVYVQDTMRLVQRLIELKKADWDYQVYPTENHGFQETSRLDYLHRLIQFFGQHLK
jgi:dipeptidyl aminopeptidase/acylaminoacyl peptidase